MTRLLLDLRLDFLLTLRGCRGNSKLTPYVDVACISELFISVTQWALECEQELC